MARGFLAFIALTMLAALDTAAATEKKPSASIEIHQVQVAFLVGGAFGGGTLHYGGKRYDLNVGGLGIGGIGASTIDAKGEVYDLKKRGDIEGVYGQARIGWAIGDAGEGDMWLQNDKGVVIRLRATRKGAMLAMGADGVVLTLKQ